MKKINFKIFKKRKNKNVVTIDYSHIKDLQNYDDRINALKNIFIGGKK